MEAGSTKLLLTPEMQRAIKGVHEKGHKIFTYMDPISGIPLPELHRRNRGIALWKAGLDGTMTWAYTHIGNNSPDDKYLSDMICSYVLRTKNAPLGSLGWEGFREGVDDARYLATLQYCYVTVLQRKRFGTVVARPRARSRC